MHAESLTTPARVEAASLPTEAISAIPENETATGKLQRYTVQMALAFKIDPTIPVYVVQHESDWQPTAVGDHGLAKSCAQFHQATFNEMKREASLPLLEYTNCADQITLLNWALAHHEGSQWTTYRRLISQEK